MAKYEAGFIGAGNMGGALALAAAKKTGGDRIAVACSTRERSEAAAQRLGCTAETPQRILSDSRFVFLGVKPQMVVGVVESLKADILASEGIFVSMLAGVSVITAAAADGWLRLDVTETDGQTRHVITGDDAVYIWYGSSRKVYSGASALTQDAEQGILTYEDILALPPERIAAADYRALEGVNCIYVETEPDDAGYVERYWVSVSSGLLAAAERECDGAVVYRMAALTVSYDGVDAEDFTLPNGTVLYEPAVAATKEISEND